MTMLTAAQAADRLLCTPWRVYQLIRAGTLPAVRLGRSVRIDSARLEQWIADGGTAPHRDRPAAATAQVAS